MRVAVLAALLARAAAGQPMAVLDDLERRAGAALDVIPRPATRSEIEMQREPLRQKLEQSLGVARARYADAIPALLDLPDTAGARAPAIVLLRPHDDPGAVGSRTFAAGLTRLGFVVLSLDVRALHDRLELLPAGIAPQGLTQRAVRTGLAYLLSRPDVDGQRIGLLGAGLMATLAAAIHPQFSAVVLADGAPDLKQYIHGLRLAPTNELPDTCNLVPGLLRHAATQDLLAMIAPRPLLAINPAPGVVNHAIDVYRSFGAFGKLQQVMEPESARESRYAAYRWFARWLQSRDELPSFSENSAADPAAELRLPDLAPVSPAQKQPLSRAILASLLGEPLPQASMGYGINVARWQRITLTTQPGLAAPLTVYRPGLDGGDPGVGSLVAIHDDGRGALHRDEIVQEAIRRGWMVWAVDPRGIGELKVSEGFVFGASLLLGENFVWRQAWDISRIIALIGPGTPSHRVAVYACGKNTGLAAAYVAATAESSRLPEWIALRDAIFSFSDAADRPPHFLAFDALSTFDIADLLAMARPKVVVIKDAPEFLRADW